MPPRILRGAALPRSTVLPFRHGQPASMYLLDNARRSFSVSVPLHTRKGITRLRKAMWQWLKGPGAVFKEPRQSSTNYLTSYDRSGRRKDGPAKDEQKTDGDKSKTQAEPDGNLKPFPENPFFYSQSVLSVPLRDEIHRRVVEKGHTVREVSQELSVSMERVGAVVRLKTLENDFVRDGKPMARPYQRAVLDMLPQTPYDPRAKRPTRHESINDLPIHRATHPQIFHPTSESRHFTREDASQIFARNLLPADERIPHPDMIATERDRLAGVTASERAERRRGRWDAEMTARDEQRVRAERARTRRETLVPGQRWDFRVTKVQVDEGPRDERSRSGVGWRYGLPLGDRKKGRVLIPTSVE